MGRSRQHISALVFGKTVTVDYHKTDRYGRTVGTVLVNGRDVNLEQVRAGLAWHYKQYQDEQTASSPKTPKGLETSNAERGWTWD